jgi:pimeloyl-ACP methyl ester carboxylesterase
VNIDLLESVRLGDAAQWIRIRAANAGSPPLLLVQMGPALPMINEVRTFERVLSLEDDFTVIYWDQRGCGRSLRSASPTQKLDLQAMVDDTEQLLELLRARFGVPAAVVGFSMGATISAYVAARRPDLLAALVTVGMDIDGAAIGENAYEFALKAARDQSNRKAIRQLEAIGPPPHLEPKQFGTRMRWDLNFGGARTGYTYGSSARGLASSLLRSPDYSLADIFRIFGRMAATQAALLPDIAALDLMRTVTRLEVPIVMAQGRLDQVAPPAVAEQYAALLEAPSKQLVWFEHSAHMPHLEEPERFSELLATVRLGLPARTGETR